MKTFPSVRHVSVTIDRTPEHVYAFASDPGNLPLWARGLSGTIERAGDHWVAQSPMGRVTIRFVVPNALGVLDHDVTLPTGSTVHNPMRVVRNGEGAEVVFTLFRRPEMSPAELEADAAAVEADLRALKALLERGQ